MPPSSRLSRTQTRRYTRQAIIFFILTLALIIAIIFFGLGFFVKGAGFLLNLRSANTADNTTSTDTTPPPPQLFPIIEATNSGSINIQGFSQPGNEITLFQNSKSLKTQVADQDGNFTFSLIALESGENRFWATAKNQGQDSQLSNQIATVLDQTPPSLTISSPEPNTNLFGPQEKTVTVQGKTEPDTALYLNNRFISINQDAEFSTTVSLKEGNNPLHFKAVDLSGNTTEKDISVNYVP